MKILEEIICLLPLYIYHKIGFQPVFAIIYHNTVVYDGILNEKCVGDIVLEIKDSK